MSKQVFLSHVNHSSKLIKPKEGILGRPQYSQSVRSAGNDLCLQLVSEVEGGLLGLNIYLWNLILSLSRLCQN